MRAWIAAATLVTLIAFVPNAAATWQVFGPGPFSISGVAQSCNFGLMTPIPNTTVWLQGFTGWINGTWVPLATHVIVALSSGSVSCTFLNPGWWVSGTGTGFAMAGP